MTLRINTRLRASLLGLSLIACVACGSDGSTSSPGGPTKDGGAAGGAHDEAGGAPGQGAGGSTTTGGQPGHATGGGNASGGSSNGGAAGSFGAGGTAGAGGGHLGTGGGAACPPECFVANRCVTACGRTPVYVGCCACPTGTMSTSTCSTTDSGAP